MKARRTAAAMDRPTRAPTLGREDHRGTESQEGAWEAACYRRSVPPRRWVSVCVPFLLLSFPSTFFNLLPPQGAGDDLKDISPHCCFLKKN